MKNLFTLISLIFFGSCEQPEYQDCSGIVNGGAYFDECGNCVGGKTGIAECVADCNGNLGGNAFLNECDICVEGLTGIQRDSCGHLSFNGYDYHTIIIGNQVWINEDLKTKKFKDGSLIPDFSTDHKDTIGTKSSFSSQNNENINYYYSANVFLNELIIPTGWRIPTKLDIELMLNFLGGDSISGGKLKDKGFYNWYYPNQFATNETNFSAFGKGQRNLNGFLINEGKKYSLWTSDTVNTINTDTTYFWALELSYDSNHALISANNSLIGNSIRFIKD